MQSVHRAFVGLIPLMWNAGHHQLCLLRSEDRVCIVTGPCARMRRAVPGVGRGGVSPAGVLSRAGVLCLAHCWSRILHAHVEMTANVCVTAGLSLLAATVKARHRGG